MTGRTGGSGTYRVRLSYRARLAARLLVLVLVLGTVIWGPWSSSAGLSSFARGLRALVPFVFWLSVGLLAWAVALMRPTTAHLDDNRLVLPPGSNFTSRIVRFSNVEVVSLDDRGGIEIRDRAGSRILFDSKMLVDPNAFLAELESAVGKRFRRVSERGA